MTPRQIGYAIQDSFNRHFMDNEAIGSFISNAITFLGWAIIAYIVLLAFVHLLTETKAFTQEKICNKKDDFNPNLKIEQPPEFEIEYLFSDCNICKGKGYVEHNNQLLQCHFCASIYQQSKYYKGKLNE